MNSGAHVADAAPGWRGGGGKRSGAEREPTRCPLRDGYEAKEKTKKWARGALWLVSLSGSPARRASAPAVRREVTAHRRPARPSQLKNSTEERTVTIDVVSVVLVRPQCLSLASASLAPSMNG